MSKARRQMSAKAERAGAARGEAERDRASDEACGPPREHPDTGSATPKAGPVGLLEAALTRENLQAAWRRVKANKGAAGVDGLDIEQTASLLHTQWPQIQQALLAGEYRPRPVRRVMIPKADGSQRELGIPTVLDRLIQQALLQVLQPLIDPTFSEHSYGFRPGRRAHDAVKAARAYVQSGKRVVVDVDLARFFDRVNHDILIDRLGKRLGDTAVVRLIRAYLNAGIMDGGVVIERHQGTPQGGPLSPLLANVLLDEVDKALEARGYVQSGKRVVVDVDLARFFDRVNHDILIDRLGKRLGDTAVVRLIRAYLNAGIMDGGVVIERHQGTPQGGPLSPLLANVLLDEVDKALEARGYCFARYADDCNVYVGSKKAGDRVMAWLCKLYRGLRLEINDAKSAVGSVFGRQFLGYALWVSKGREVKCRVSTKALGHFKARIRHLTRRSGGRSLAQVIEKLRSYLLGWKAYFGLAQTPGVWRTLDAWLRHRLRAIQLKHWKRPRVIYRELRTLGATATVARRVAANSRRWWRNSGRLLQTVLTIGYFDRMGMPRLS